MKQWIGWHQSEQNNISCGILTLETMTQLSMVDVQEAIEQLNIGKKQLHSRWYWYRYGSLFSLHSRMYSQFLLELPTDTSWSNVAKINFVYEYLRRLFSICCRQSHGFKNRYGERTGNGTNYRFFDRTRVQSMVEPVIL